MFVQAIYTIDEKQRPKSGWLLYRKTEKGKLVPLLSQRERQIKVKTLDQVLTEVQKKVPKSVHTIKVEYISDKGLVYGTLFFDPSRPVLAPAKEAGKKIGKTQRSR